MNKKQQIAEKPKTTRERIVDVAQELFFTQGFGATPVEQIIRTLDIAKGTFYHHFNGKTALLDEIVERYAEDVFAAVQPIVDSDELSAPEKLAAYMKRGISWKVRDRRTAELMRIFYASENALMREKLAEGAVEYAIRALTPIIRQGVAEGVYTTPIPDRVAGLIWRSTATLGHEMGRLMLSNKGTDLSLEVERLVSDMEYVIERLIGAPAGSVTVLDRDDLGDVVALMKGDTSVAPKEGAQV